MKRILQYFQGLSGTRPVPLRSRPDRKLGEQQFIQIVFNREIFLIRVKRHRQARRYTLRIHAASREAILTMPPRGTIREAKSFAEQHGGWIAARLARLPETIPFVDGGIVPLRGEPHRIVHRPGRRGTVWAENDADVRILCVAGAEAHLSRRVADFLKREAHRDLDAASRRIADQLNVSIKRVMMRDPVSRWGSCSSSGVLSYSWRLILAPPFVLEYLAVHEAAHLVEMNHSPRFWRIVHERCPDVDRAKAWLDANGAELHRYGEPKA